MAEPYVRLICADVMEGLQAIPDHSVHCVVTSPPYHGLRDYGLPPRLWPDGSTCVLGQEPTLALFIDHLVDIFVEVRRVLHPTGTFWLNMGDSYQHAGPQPSTGIHRRNAVPLPNTYKRERTSKSKKNLGMVPARVALALQEDGWILRQDIVWAKGLSFCPTYSGSVMPESIVDRCVWSHEHVFHFAAHDKYFYDIEACREPYAEGSKERYQYAFGGKKNKQLAAEGRIPVVGFRPYKGQATKDYGSAMAQDPSETKRRVMASMEAGTGRNLRNVWVIPKEPLKEAHFASFPTKLVEPIVKLGASEKGCCPRCWAPWIRNTIREQVPPAIQAQFEASRATTAADTGRGDGYTHRKPNYRRRVLSEGWSPTCRCVGEDGAGLAPVPTVVLDPFSGSGRAGVVAHRLGRSFIGIDANPAYVAMAGRAILGDAGARDQAPRAMAIDASAGRGEVANLLEQSTDDFTKHE